MPLSSLSRNLTPQLGSAGKRLVIALIFAGRVLYPTRVLGLARRSPPAEDPVDWI